MTEAVIQKNNSSVSEYLPVTDGTMYGKISQIKNVLSMSFDTRINVITGRVEISPKGRNEFSEMTDIVFNSLRARLIEQYLFSPIQAEILHMVFNSDFSRRYDPVQEFLCALPTEDDGRDAIAELSLKATVTANQFGDGIDTATVFCEYLKKWMAANVAMWADGKPNHTCLSLLGAQGIGKTAFLTKLGISDRLTYVGAINPDDKDSRIMYVEKALIVLDELEATTRHELSALKSQMTQEFYDIRRPYSRNSESLPRRAAFCASANDSGILSDNTGSRRFLCVQVDSIDYDIPRELVRRAYSQALRLYRSGFKYWFDEDDIRELEKNNSGFYAACPEEECLLSVFKPDQWNGLCVEYLTNTEIINVLAAKNPGLRFSSKKLGQVLSAKSFERGMKGGVYKYAVMRN